MEANEHAYHNKRVAEDDQNDGVTAAGTECLLDAAGEGPVRNGLLMASVSPGSQGWTTLGHEIEEWELFTSLIPPSFLAVVG